MLERLIRDGPEVTLILLVGALDLVLLVVVEEDAAHGEFAGQECAIDIEDEPVRAEVVELGFEFGEITAQLRDLGGRVDQAGGLGEAEEDRVGAAEKFGPVGVVAIGGAEHLDVVDRRARTAETADPHFAGAVVVVAEITADIAVGAAEAGHGFLMIGRVILGPGHERERAGDIVGREVVHELVGQDGDGGSDVLQVGLQPARCERAGGEVSGVL